MYVKEHVGVKAWDIHDSLGDLTGKVEVETVGAKAFSGEI